MPRVPYTGQHRQAYPLKNIFTAPPGYSRPYRRTTTYVLGDIDDNDNGRNGNTEYTIHRDKCDTAREMFNTSIDCNRVVRVRYRGRSDSRWVVQYFRNEISKHCSNDLMIIYAHVKSRENDDSYSWQSHGNGHWINVSDLMELFIEHNVDAMIICDGTKPSHPSKKWTKEDGNLEFISNREACFNDDGSSRSYTVTAAMRDALADYIDVGYITARFRQSIPMIMGKNSRMWSNPSRTWTKKTEQLSDKVVERIIVEQHDVGTRRKIRLHRCRIQGPAPEDQDDEDDDPPFNGAGGPPGDDDDDSDEDDSGSDARNCGADSGNGDDDLVPINDDNRRSGDDGAESEPINLFEQSLRRRDTSIPRNASPDGGETRLGARQLTNASGVRLGSISRKRSSSPEIVTNGRLGMRASKFRRSGTPEVVDLTSDERSAQRRRGRLQGGRLPVSSFSATVDLTKDSQGHYAAANPRRTLFRNGNNATTAIDVEEVEVGVKHGMVDLTKEKDLGGNRFPVASAPRRMLGWAVERREAGGAISRP